jgi:hypothetical protein
MGGLEHFESRFVFENNFFLLPTVLIKKISKYQTVSPILSLANPRKKPKKFLFGPNS